MMKWLLLRFQTILTYLSHSILSTILDSVIVWMLFQHMDVSLTVANTAGVVAGFVLGFFLDVKRTFRSHYTTAAFAVYFGTFLAGLLLANALIKGTYAVVDPYLPEVWSFLISKGVSVAVPFFAMYFVRKYAYRAINRRKKEQ